jgi:hypothetical protein
MQLFWKCDCLETLEDFVLLCYHASVGGRANAEICNKCACSVLFCRGAFERKASGMRVWEFTECTPEEMKLGLFLFRWNRGCPAFPDLMCSTYYDREWDCVVRASHSDTCKGMHIKNAREASVCMRSCLFVCFFLGGGRGDENAFFAGSFSQPVLTLVLRVCCKKGTGCVPT